jgi:hypothetical protein
MPTFLTGRRLWIAVVVAAVLIAAGIAWAVIRANRPVYSLTVVTTGNIPAYVATAEGGAHTLRNESGHDHLAFTTRGRRVVVSVSSTSDAPACLVTDNHTGEVLAQQTGPAPRHTSTQLESAECVADLDRG